MSEDHGRRHARRDAAAFNDADVKPARDRLVDAIEAAAGSVTSDAEESAWMLNVFRSDVLRRAPLSTETLEVLAEILPAASVTEEFRSKLERRRLARRLEWRLYSDLEAECRAASPAELFHDLRERSGMSAERTASLFGISPGEWMAIESRKRPWYVVSPDALPAFANAVSEPTERLIGLITVAARRAVFAGVVARAGHALGRFDATRDVVAARRDTLRAAFSMVEAENRGAAIFLVRAQRAAAKWNREETIQDNHTVDDRNNSNDRP